jgi:1-acyl-sn-glycerol-3-phosphate acyltransferase
MLLYVRSALFLVWFVVVSLVLNVGSVPLLLAPRRMVVWAANKWARLVLFGLKHIAGLDMAVRNKIAVSGPVLIAAKHFSIWETIAILALLRDPAVVLKRELLWVPLYGWFCAKMEMIAVDRKSGSKAIRRMHAAATRALEAGRPIVIFPEGTRKKIGAAPDYKPGVAGLYAQLEIACVPVAHNSGMYWTGPFLRRPGTIIVEYLEPIPPGLSRRDFMALLERRIEEATGHLVAEARGRETAHVRTVA